MPRIFEDVDVVIDGATYRFRDTARLKSEGDTVSISEASQSLGRMLRYVLKIYPGFIKCGSGSSCEEDKLDRKEAHKAIRELGRNPTASEWRSRTDAKRAEIRRRRRKHFEPIYFQMLKNGVHAGCLFIDEIQVKGRRGGGKPERRTITRVKIQVTLALDAAENDNDAWQTLYAEIGVWMLRNAFFSLRGDPRKFQVEEFNLPDIYDGTRSNVNSAAVAVLTREGIPYKVYSNTSEQKIFGLKKLKSISLTNRRRTR